MREPLNLVELLRRADSTTRREFLRRAALTGLAIPALGALSSACGPGPPLGTGGVSGKPKRGGTFVTMGHQTVTSLSPDDAGPTVLYVVTSNIHESLLDIDHDYKIFPRLAESYQPSADAKTWTFKLRRGVRWHDGQPFTAADVKYNYEWLRDPNNAAIGQPLFADIARIDTPDEFTVVVSLKQANVPFAVLSATRLLVPKHVHEKIGEKEYKQKPVGTGPYKLKEWRPAEFALLEANDDYWDGRPWIDFFRQNIVPEVASRAIALQAGQADSSTWPLTPEDHIKLGQDKSFIVYRAPGNAANHFPTNNQRPLFQDKRVRQAMMYAIDREALVKDLLKGFAAKATANLTPASAQFYESNVTQYPYDPEKAKALLRQSGWTSGQDGVLMNARGEKFRFVCNVFVGDTLRRSEAEAVQRNLKDVGIQMELRDSEPTTVLNAARKGDYDMALYNWTYGSANEPDARVTLSSKGLNNFSHYSNPRLDDLLERGVAEVDEAKRAAIYKEIQRIVAEDVPFLYIMFWDTVVVFSRRIKGLIDKAANPYALYNELHKFWIEEA